MNRDDILGEIMYDFDMDIATITWRDRLWLWLYPTQVQKSEGFILYWKQARGKLWLMNIKEAE